MRTARAEDGDAQLLVVDVEGDPAPVLEVEAVAPRARLCPGRPRVVGEEAERGARGLPERELEVRDQRAAGDEDTEAEHRVGNTRKRVPALPVDAPLRGAGAVLTEDSVHYRRHRC